jgi:ribosomal protein S18 acetylase RimI-like enzyme
MMLSFFSVLFGILALKSVETAALIVSSPGAIGIDTKLVTSPPEEHIHHLAAQAPLVLRIRSTREQDLPQVTSLLASASIATDESKWNWKTSMQVLRTKSTMQSLLSSRLDAINEGQRVAASLPLHDSVSNSDKMRLLWSHDDFRRKLEKAATLAQEPHVWNHFDFCYHSNHPNILRHTMMTAEDVLTGNVVGFCEVAMLALPSSRRNEVESISSAPTIANLASSKKHRRRGIASSLLKSAKELVQRQWSSDEIALYVDSANKGAISLYSKHGFIPKEIERERGVLYMTKSFQQKESSSRLLVHA